MVRTQIYLTDVEHRALRTLARRTGRTQSELIREAIDAMLAVQGPADRVRLLRQARGMWADHVDVPELADLRREFDRSMETTD